MSIRRHSVLALLGPAAAFLCGLAAAKPAGSLPTAGSWFVAPRASASCYVAMPRNWLVCSRSSKNGLTLSMQPKGRARRGAPSRRSAPPLLPPGPLYVGDSWNHGDFTCVVRKAGLTCRNRARHGWFLGRWSYKLF